MCFKKITITLFFVSLALGITGIVLDECVFEGYNLLSSLSMYLSYFLIIALFFLIIIGFQGEIKNDLLKALFHAYLSTVAIVIISSIVLPIVNGWSWNFSNVLFCLKVSPVSFLIIKTDASGYLLLIILALSWSLFILIIGFSIWGIRKCKTRSIYVLGQIIVITIFGLIFSFCHNAAVCAIAIIRARGATFLTEVQSSYTIAKSALDSDDETESVKLWRNLFGLKFKPRE